jgi:serine/threonine protein kinase
VLLADLSDEADARRFRRECALLGQLGQQRHIVDVYDAGVTRDRRPYITMRYYSRGTLADRLRSEGAVPAAEAVAMLRGLAEAVQAGHDLGVVHRDIKPDNVLIDDEGSLLLADFGVAAWVDETHTRTASGAFSTAYAAPEVFDGNRYSVASDVYSLGATGYTVVSGQAPFRSTTGIRQMMAIANDPPEEITTPGVPQELKEVLLGAMAKEPADRPESARQFSQLLEAALRRESPKRTTGEDVLSIDSGPSSDTILLDMEPPVPNATSPLRPQQQSGKQRAGWPPLPAGQTGWGFNTPPGTGPQGLAPGAPGRQPNGYPATETIAPITGMPADSGSGSGQDTSRPVMLVGGALLIGLLAIALVWILLFRGPISSSSGTTETGPANVTAPWTGAVDPSCSDLGAALTADGLTDTIVVRLNDVAMATDLEENDAYFTQLAKDIKPIMDQYQAACMAAVAAGNAPHFYRTFLETFESSVSDGASVSTSALANAGQVPADETARLRAEATELSAASQAVMAITGTPSPMASTATTPAPTDSGPAGSS